MPLDSESLNKSCSPLPPLVRQNAVELIELIHNSKASAEYENPNINGAYMTSHSPLPYKPPQESMTPETSTNKKKQEAASSPVLSTNELYQSAGWVSDNKMNGSHQNQKFLKLSGDGSSVPLFDISGVLESYKTGSRRKSRDVLLSPCPQSMAASSLLDFSTPTTVSEDDSSEAAKLRRKAREIHDSFNTPQSSIHLFSTPNVNTVNSYSKDNKRKSPGDDVPFSSLVSPTPPSLQTVPSPNLDEEIPRSMREIYQMSNKNRKMNKEKKKLKQSARIDPTPVFKDVTGDSSASGNSTRSDSLILNEEKFMKNIGWIKDANSTTEEPKSSNKNTSNRRQVKQQEKKNENKGSGKSNFSKIKNMIRKHKQKKNFSHGGGKSKTFNSYDYSKTNSHTNVGGEAAPPGSYFNPYGYGQTSGKKRHHKSKNW